jgi:hypothetical protein
MAEKDMKGIPLSKNQQPSIAYCNTMHGTMNLKFIEVKQATEVYQ